MLRSKHEPLLDLLLLDVDLPVIDLACLVISDIDGDGHEEIFTGGRGGLWWLRPATLERGQIDKIHLPHSLSAADLDGDGRIEIIAGEHDPFNPYRSRCRLLMYKQANQDATAWWQTVIDDRFEHYNGAQIFRQTEGKQAIISHGRQDSRYVHLWEFG